jgi:hypothetical protein
MLLLLLMMMMMMNTFLSNGEQLIGTWGKFHNEELFDSYSLLRITTI